MSPKKDGPQEFGRVYEAREEVRAHCKRVAALAVELGAFLGMSSADKEALHEAALLHHVPKTMLSPRLSSRLISEVWEGAEAPAGADQSVPAAAAEILMPLRGLCRRGENTASQIEILEIANAFDEEMEFLPFDERPTERILEDFTTGQGDDCWSGRVRQALHELRALSREDLRRAASQLPVFPKAAYQAMALLRDEHASISQITRVAGSDQVIAASLLKVANSGLYGRSQEIRTLDRAIAQIGFDATRKLMLALSTRPLFASGRLAFLWEHSIEIAEITASLAEQSGRINPEEAYVAGLLHDIGRLVMERIPVFVVGLYAGLMEQGCPPAYAEAVLAGCDHGAIGARLLEDWGLPGDLTAAIRDHHRPELSSPSLSALLYLAEWKSGAEEDLPSSVRLTTALGRAGLTIEALDSADSNMKLVKACCG